MAEEKFEMENIEPLMDEPKKEAAKNPNKYERVIQPCIAELIGTTFFVFIGCVSVIENVETAGRLQPALVHGLAVAILITCMAEISCVFLGPWRAAGPTPPMNHCSMSIILFFFFLQSGSHFNPPFTMAIYLCGGIELFLVLPYLVCQLIGGLIGAAMAKLMTTEERFARAHGAAFTILQSNEQIFPALFGEIAMTFMVTMVVLLAAVNDKSKSPLVPFLVGCAVIISVLAGADVSGTCLNPARAMGPAVMSGYWSYHWVYWVGPFTGSLIAVIVVRILLGDHKMRILWK